MAEWPCCHDPLRFSPLSLRFVPPPTNRFASTTPQARRLRAFQHLVNFFFQRLVLNFLQRMVNSFPTLGVEFSPTLGEFFPTLGESFHAPASCPIAPVLGAHATGIVSRRANTWCPRHAHAPCKHPRRISRQRALAPMERGWQCALERSACA